MSQTSPVKTRGLTVGAVVFALGGLGLLGGYFLKLSSAEAGVAVPPVEAVAVSAPTPGAGAALIPSLETAAQHALAQRVTLDLDGKEVPTSWQELAFVVDDASLARLADRLAADKVEVASIGDDVFARHELAVPLVMDRDKGVEALIGFKDRYDRAPIDARVDLEKRTVKAEQPGFGIDIYASVGSLEQAARSGAARASLVTASIPPSVTRAKLGNIDVSHIMGYFETHYPMGERDRNYNLKVAAEKLNGHVIMPGEEFSFNGIVGDRTEKEGYRVAHVISAGELIDGLAGGTCQISSTLHGAAFFAGLDIVKSRPHSRPSAYITMGMDATVVYPTTDLRLKNPYPFPVAIRYVVAQGVVRVEILGKERPWSKISFERDIKEEIPFETITREDDKLPIGASLVEQPGFPGYKLERRRVFYKHGQVDHTERWKLDYPPTTEYLRIGQIVEVERVVAVRGIAREAHPGPGVRPRVSEHHLLNDRRRSDMVGNAVEFAVALRALAHPRLQYCLH
jgi:vancomycin resistance protein YoaR